LELHRNSNSQSGSPFGSVWVQSPTLSYTPRSVKCDSRASFLAHTFVSPCLGYEPKAKTATQPLLFCWWLSFRHRSYFRPGGILFSFGHVHHIFHLIVFEIRCMNFYENYFVLDDFTSDFNMLFEVCGHIDGHHVPLFILHLLMASWLLILGKQIGDIWCIVIGEVTYWLVAYAFII